MMLSNYSTFVCSKVGQTDSTSTALCKEFVKTRYKMIWDAFLWNDSTVLIPNLTADTSGVMTYPLGIERIVSIRSTGDHILDPTNSPFIMQVSPSSFEDTGDPLAYEDFTDTTDSNKRKIRLFPIPKQSTAILIFGKRTFVPLAVDSDTPVLRNIDNALQSYAEGDMLSRQRKRGAAQAIYSEALEHLTLMQKIETQQAGHLSKIVPQVTNGYQAWDCYGLTKGDFA